MFQKSLCCSRTSWWSAALVVLVGCQEANVYQPPPPPEVTVQKPARSRVPRAVEFTGTARASERVELRTRVTGFIESVEFEAGTDVEEGDLLFVIDKAPFEARVAQFDADVMTRKAELETRKAVASSKAEDFRRIEQLAKDGAATEQQYTQALADKAESAASVMAAQASIASAEAALKQAQIDLAFAEIKAPISGRVSERYVDRGNLVSANENTVLATIVKYQPIYVYFNISEQELLAFRSNRARDGSPRSSNGKSGAHLPIMIKLQNQKDFTIEGEVDYGDVTVDSSTGTFMLRATVPNEDLEVLPGYFVRIRAVQSIDENSLLIPDTAIGYDQGGRFVMLAESESSEPLSKAESAVKKQYIELGPSLDGWRQVLAGLEADDRVIVTGVQRARDGSTVLATEVPAVDPFAGSNESLQPVLSDPESETPSDTADEKAEPQTSPQTD